MPKHLRFETPNARDLVKALEHTVLYARAKDDEAATATRIDADEKNRKAATRIQSCYRGRLARLRVKMMRADMESAEAIDSGATLDPISESVVAEAATVQAKAGATYDTNAVAEKVKA